MAGRKLSSNGLPLDHYANCALKQPFKEISEFQSITYHKNNSLYRSTAITLYLEWIDLARRYRKSTVSNQNQSKLLRQTAGVRIWWQACWSKSSICTLSFSVTKCFISFRKRLEMSKGKKHFSWAKTIKAVINVAPSRKTHEIEANSDQRQKIIMVFLARNARS